MLLFCQIIFTFIAGEKSVFCFSLFFCPFFVCILDVCEFLIICSPNAGAVSMCLLNGKCKVWAVRQASWERELISALAFSGMNLAQSKTFTVMWVRRSYIFFCGCRRCTFVCAPQKRYISPRYISSRYISTRCHHWQQMHMPASAAAAVMLDTFVHITSCWCG